MTSEANEALTTTRRRMAAVSSVAGEVAHRVRNFTYPGQSSAPSWLAQLGVPTGWRIGHLTASPFEPSRMAFSGQRTDGGWDGCETISVFGFTGSTPSDVVRDNADRTLRDLGATRIKIEQVDTSASPRLLAVRSSGIFLLAGRWLWAQYSNYVLRSAEPPQGQLIEHSIFIDATCQQRRVGDVLELTHAVQHALASMLATH